MQDIAQQKAMKMGWFPLGGNESPEPGSRSLIRAKKQDKVKLWQLEHNYHCAIIGTCLSMSEVKKLLRQLHIGTNGFAAYDVHTTIVTLISENNFRSKKVQSYLDKKFNEVIQQTKGMQAAELKGFWKSSLYSGDMIGAFWAVMSHPESNEPMKRIIYGDIHMLSHLSGASNRADLKRLSLLEKERDSQDSEKRRLDIKCQKLASENNRLLTLIQEHHEQQSGLENQVYALKNSLDQMMILESTKEREGLENQLEKLKNRLNIQENRMTKYLKKERQFVEIIARQKRGIITSQDALLISQNEVEYLQVAFVEKLQPQCPLSKQDLGGKCVLYVGGKTNLIPYYRELVEDHSGVFIHHDGGLEKNTQDLQCSLSKADVVVFPSSCISHDAFWKIKSICSKQNKSYQYLKSSGLYSLSCVLNLIMSNIESSDSYICANTVEI